MYEEADRQTFGNFLYGCLGCLTLWATFYVCNSSKQVRMLVASRDQHLKLSAAAQPPGSSCHFEVPNCTCYSFFPNPTFFLQAHDNVKAYIDRLNKRTYEAKGLRWMLPQRQGHLSVRCCTTRLMILTLPLSSA